MFGSGAFENQLESAGITATKIVENLLYTEAKDLQQEYPEGQCLT